MKSIKEALDEYRKEIYHIDRQPAAIFGENDRDDIMRSIGFQDCLDLLFPLVEALGFYADRAAWSENPFGQIITKLDYETRGVNKMGDCTLINYGGKRARQALADLKAKLGVE